jgi:heme/copper-type cytochrome/quinol oxidase subunit 2
VKFEKPGPYQILCLEYCGPLHHLMRASLTAR